MDVARMQKREWVHRDWALERCARINGPISSTFSVDSQHTGPDDWPKEHDEETEKFKVYREVFENAVRLAIFWTGKVYFSQQLTSVIVAWIDRLKPAHVSWRTEKADSFRCKGMKAVETFFRLLFFLCCWMAPTNTFLVTSHLLEGSWHRHCSLNKSSSNSPCTSKMTDNTICTVCIRATCTNLFNDCSFHR